MTNLDALNRKGLTEVFRKNSVLHKVYVLRSNEEHDIAGVWHKVFMCYGSNAVIVTEYENGVIDNTETMCFTYKEARKYWDNWKQTFHRDDTCTEGLPLGDIKL